MSFSGGAGLFTDSFAPGNSSQQFVIRNTSTAGWNIIGLTLNFSAATGTPKFDTVAGGFGFGTALGVSSQGSVGSGAAIVTTPTNASLDGTSIATFSSITSMDTSDAIAIRFDLDWSAPVSTAVPNLTGGVVTVTFQNSFNNALETVSGQFAAPLQAPINNASFGAFTGSFNPGSYYHLVSASAITAVPEPSTFAMLLVGVASTMGWRYRKSLLKSRK